MEWKKFYMGLALAALCGALTYAQALPQPYGAIAASMLTILAHFGRSSLPSPEAS